MAFDIITAARAAGIELNDSDIAPTGTIDGLDPADWLDAMTSE